MINYITLNSNLKRGVLKFSEKISNQGLTVMTNYDILLSRQG